MVTSPHSPPNTPDREGPTAKHLEVCARLLASCADARADDIMFEALTAEMAGIEPVFETGYDDDMKQQGGPGKETHGWWP